MRLVFLLVYRTKKGENELDLYLSRKHDELLAKNLQPGSYTKTLSLVIVDGFAVEITNEQVTFLNIYIRICFIYVLMFHECRNLRACVGASNFYSTVILRRTHRVVWGCFRQDIHSRMPFRHPLAISTTLCVCVCFFFFIFLALFDKSMRMLLPTFHSRMSF